MVNSGVLRCVVWGTENSFESSCGEVRSSRYAFVRKWCRPPSQRRCQARSARVHVLRRIMLRDFTDVPESKALSDGSARTSNGGMIIAWVSHPPARANRVIKFSVMYPNTPGARFDHDYYRDRHMPLVKARMGAHLKSYAIERGVSGGAPGQPAT